ncbi:MAG: DinB family protein [Cyclobacteriaceae bacterium]|nr:DinB family protein [Cyclobacteriaceae bacterium]
MNKAELKQELAKHHQEFIRLVESFSEKEIAESRNGKWSPAQQLDHIVKSVSPVTLAFSLPKFLLKIIFGSANRPSKTYETLIEKYKIKLAQGGVASGRFVPPNQTAPTIRLAEKLNSLIHALIKKIDSYTEPQLDHLILPHPLLGKLTLREMLYFTIYHVQHHYKQVKHHEI